MKIKINIINRVPRLLFRYKSFSTNNQMAWKYLPIPTRPKAIFAFVKNSIFGDSTIYRDELGILLSHDDIYRQSDIILAVGVGSGLSLIHNCMKPRVNDAFIGIEGSRNQIDLTIGNSKLNNIDFSKFKLIEGYVGNQNNVYGHHNQKTSNMIDINHFEFDVLELDCEGSEIEILRDLTVRPRHIIVEMHPMYRNIKINEFLAGMGNKGYNLSKVYTVNGDCVKPEIIDNYFNTNHIEKMVNNQLNWGDGLLVLNFSMC